jgi:hypothetical protein
MRSTGSLLTALVLAASTLATHADTFTYDFSALSSPDAFTYVSPVLITTETIFTPLTCVIQEIQDCSKVDINPTVEEITISNTAGRFNEYLLPPSFIMLGTQSISDVTLTVTDNPDPTDLAPEPSSIALLGTGMLSLAGVVRRRFFIR